VLVDRYINLLRAGVDPSNILAITFTRKAATEMRERIISTLRATAARGEFSPARWRELRDRTDDIAISTIDAFCLSLLREFPLEADLDPGFDVADETEVPRLIDESLDRALRTCRSLAREDEHMALVFAQLGDRRARRGLAALLNRRLVAPAVLNRYLATGPRDLDVSLATRRATSELLGVLTSMPGGLARFLASGPPEPAFLLLSGTSGRRGSVEENISLDPAVVQATYSRARDYFLTQDGEPRKQCPFKKAQFVSETAWAAHRDLVVGHAAAIKDASTRYKRDLNVLVSRGILRMYRIAETEYRRTLDAHAVLDFADLLLRALELLHQMEEFAQSRYRLESRYHHVLVDEFQDTSRAQWELVSLLVQSWGEGAGLTSSGPLPPSIFIVGDRKQSIYAFRDADVSILEDARRYIEALRPGGDARRAISRSFRSVPALLSFVNDVSRDMPKAEGRRDAFRYGEDDRFPLDGAVIDAADHSLDWSPATHPTRAPKPRLRKLCVSSPRERSFATRSQVSGGRSRRPISPFFFEPVIPTANSRPRSTAAASPHMCTKVSVSSTPTKSRTSSRFSGTSPIRCRISVPRRFCDRASCGFRTRRFGGSRRTSPRHCAARRRRLSISIRPTPRRWRRHASHARGGEASWIDCRPPSSSISC
jgi:ATP-dependent exoDNAse (exonuclease V) beta subunit